MSRPNPENRPSFFHPLHKTEQTIMELNESIKGIRFRVSQANSNDLQELQDTLQDLNATLIEAKQLITKARKQEKKARTRER